MNTPVNKLLATVTAITALSGCHAMQLSAQWACSDPWGRAIPEAERTTTNCRPAVATRGAHGSQSAQGQVTQVYLPTGGYQITRSGSTVFVNQTSRGR